MIKAQKNNIKFFFLFISFLCLCIFNTSCGLDSIEVMEEPYPSNSNPIFDDVDHTQSFTDKTFSFTTNESTSYSEINLIGTAVYYKIYNNFSSMYSERSSLILASESETSSANSALTLMQLYKPLKASNSSDDILIPVSAGLQNQLVTIRLTDYDDNFSSFIKVNGNYLRTPSERCYPVRSFDSSGYAYSFNFGGSGDYDKKPESGNSDYKESSSFSKPETYYVCLFAVSVGIDTTFTRQYSNIVYLGTVDINAASERN